MRATSVHIAVVAFGLAAATFAGCAGGEDATKAGGSAPPLTLRIGTADPPGRPGSDQVEEFARRVKELSRGRLRVEPVWDADGAGADWDQEVARMVVSGGLDLGMIPTRAWDTEGVTTLRALSAPFLITSDEHLDRVVIGELADEMLAGVGEAGVVGLALVPEGLRHPFAFGKPLLGPEDYAGQTIRAPTSSVATAFFAALGARADDLAQGFDQLVMEGKVAGAESSFAWAMGLPGRPVATGNVTFYPKVNALVVDEDVFGRLDEKQRGILQEAAARTRAWAIGAMPTDAEAAKLFCEAGGAVVLASKSDLAALEQAAAAVYGSLERDPQTKRFIERIRALRPAVSEAGATPAPCNASA